MVNSNPNLVVFTNTGFLIVRSFAPRREVVESFFGSPPEGVVLEVVESFFGLCSRAYVRHKFYRFTIKNINEIAINYPKPNHHFVLSFFGGKSIS